MIKYREAFIRFNENSIERLALKCLRKLSIKAALVNLRQTLVKVNRLWIVSDLNGEYQPLQKTQTAYVSIYVKATFTEPDKELTVLFGITTKKNFALQNFQFIRR